MINVNNICTDVEILNVISIFKTIINIACIIVPVILVIMLSIDIIKTISSSEVETKKLYNTIAKRVIAAVIIFLIPALLNLALSVIPMKTSYYLACYNNASKEEILYIAENNAIQDMNNLMTALSKNDYDQAYLAYEQARISIKKIPDKEVREQKQATLTSLKAKVDALKAGQDVSSSIDSNEGDDQTDSSASKYSYDYIKKLVRKYPVDRDREEIVLTAASYVGQIPYYWGGRATSADFEANKFGSLVQADKKGRTAKGLDCSHFVDFVYWQVIGDNLGNGNTRTLWEASQDIDEKHLLPGDLGFKNHPSADSNHVAIFAGIDEKGNQIWIHLTGNPINTVVINNVKMNYFRRVNVLIEEDY